jgi:hypothetical protein
VHYRIEVVGCTIVCHLRSINTVGKTCGLFQSGGITSEVAILIKNVVQKLNEF